MASWALERWADFPIELDPRPLVITGPIVLPEKGFRTHIESRERSNSTAVYRARYRGPDGRERSKSFKRKADAQRWLIQQETNKTSGTWVDPRAGAVKLRDFAEQFLEGKHDLKPKTRASYESLNRSLIEPTFGNVSIADLGPLDVDAWINALVRRGLSASRVRQAYDLLASMMKKAVRLNLRHASPCQAEDSLPRLNWTERRFLSADELDRLVAAMPAPHDLFIRVLAYTGIRYGEAAALRRGRCNLLRRRLIINESMGEVNGTVVFGLPKNGRQRTVVVPKFVCDDLATHLGTVVGQGNDSLVFTSDHGKPLRYSNFRSRYWLPALQKAEFEKPFGLHALRHSYASLASQSGASVKAVQSQLGHQDPALTLRLYQHLFDDDLDSLGERLDARFTQRSESPRPERGPETPASEDARSLRSASGSSPPHSLAPPAGLEPATHGLGNRRSIL